MTTLDDAPLDDVPAEIEPEYGAKVQALLEAAAASRLKRTQGLGSKAQNALDELSKAIKVETRLAELAAETTRVRRGEI